MKSGWRFRRTTVITIGLVAFLGGLGFARTGSVLTNEAIVVSLLVFLVTIFRLKIPAIIGALLFGFVLGWWRGQVFLRQIQPARYITGNHIVATVQAEGDAVYDDSKALSFPASHLHISDPLDQRLPGQVTVSGFGEPAVYKGDIVQIEGKLYPSRGSSQYRMSFADMKVLGRSASPIDALRRRFAAGIESALPEPLASFGLGLLIGQRNTLPDSVTAQLSIVGLTHIIAVSGYNLTIIMGAVRRVLKKRSKYQSFMLSVVLIAAFLLVTGFSASIVRAAIVSFLGLGAWYYGREFKPLLIIVLAAVLTAGWNPYYVWSDIGWYLSFLAFFGVLILSPLLHKRFYKDKEPKVIGALMNESLCAMVMTMPFILYIFQQISLLALLANLLVVPLVPLAMLFALIAGLAGTFVPVLAGICALPARILLTFMLDVVQVMSEIPHALVKRQLSLTQMLFLYGCVVFVALVLWRATKKQYATITETNTGE